MTNSNPYIVGNETFILFILLQPLLGSTSMAATCITTQDFGDKFDIILEGAQRMIMVRVDHK